MRRERVGSGATFRTSTARGGRSTSRCGDGWMQACSRCWSVMCRRLPASGPGEKASPRRCVSTAAPCSRRRSPVAGPVTMGAKRRKGSKVHIAVDTLGHLLALKVTAADQGDREQVAALAEQIQEVTGSTVELAYVDQGNTGPNAAEAAGEHGIRLEVVKHPLAKRGFVLLPRRWVVERSFAWVARFRRLARDYERLDTTLKGLHYIAFAILMTTRLVHVACQSS